MNEVWYDSYMMCIYVISYHVSLRTSNNELNEKRDFITLTIPIIEKYIVYILYIFLLYYILSYYTRSEYYTKYEYLIFLFKNKRNYNLSYDDIK